MTSATVLPERIAAVRRFNRFYTQQLGVLRHAWLDSPFSLTEARVLYEIRTRGTTTASDLVRDLDLDAGYVSRMLRRFDKDGLIRKQASRADGRTTLLSITARGNRTFQPLEDRTMVQVTELLERLAPAQQERLVGSMRMVETLLAPAPAAGAIVLRQPQPGDWGWMLERHALLYAKERGWDQTFEALCARIIAEFVAGHDPVRERAFIAELDGQRVGSVFVSKGTDELAKLRLLLVEPEARGHGLGRRLVEECITFAGNAGYRRMTLWTQSVLVSARRIYEACGFALVRSAPHESFGASLVGETWERDL